MTGIIYLYHLDAPLNPTRPSRHYIGYCSGNLAARDAVHRAGLRSSHQHNGKLVTTGAARFLQVAVERGIAFRLVRAWRGTRHDERYLKHQRNSPMLCPVCRAAVGKHPRRVTRLEDLDLTQAIAGCTNDA